MIKCSICILVVSCGCYWGNVGRLHTSAVFELISWQANHITVYSRSVAEYNDGFKNLGNNVSTTIVYIDLVVTAVKPTIRAKHHRAVGTSG